MEPFLGGADRAGGACTVERQLVEPPQKTTKREQRARSRRSDGGGERRQSVKGGVDGCWRVANIISVPGIGQRLKEQGSFSGASAFRVRVVVRSAARTLL